LEEPSSGRPEQLPPEQRAKQELVEVWQRVWLDGSATQMAATDPFGANFAGQAIHDPYLLQAL
jgi:hypothetical protein